MNDRAVGLLDHYDIEVLRTRKGRGAILCDTENGCLIFMEYPGNPEKVKLQDAVLKQLAQVPELCVERILPTKEESLLVEDTDGKRYILKTFHENRECNIRDPEECKTAIKVLARLHEAMQMPQAAAEFDLKPFSVTREYEKHNRELKKVWRYLREKGQKSLFETALLREYDYFLEQALEIGGQWQAFAMESDLDYIREQGMLCHGDYQHHNLIRNASSFAVMHFERCLMDNPVRDLSLFLRKYLEKSNWSERLGKELLDAYNKERELSARSYVELYYRLAYPEKFWKIVNFYYNSRKVWIPERNWEKLKILCGQEQEKQHFLDQVFRRIP